MGALDDAWRLASSWPVDASIAVVHSGGTETFGDVTRVQRIASVSKPLAAYATLVAVEEGSVGLDDAVGQTDCTLRHLLAHAGGYPFEGAQPIGRPGARRIYSNTGFDMVATHVETSTGIAFTEYLDDAVHDLLRRLGLQDRAEAFPDQLSGGQQQRVAIARSLAMEPEVMLLDEITSALDPELVGEVLDVVRELKGNGMTMLLATHEMAFAREIADRVCFLHQGQVLECATPSELFGSPKNERTQQFLQRVIDSGRL